MDQSCALLLRLPWTVVLCAQGLQESTQLCAPDGITYTTAEDLTRMLSDWVVLTSLVDIMVKEIATQVQSDIVLSKKMKLSVLHSSLSK